MFHETLTVLHHGLSENPVAKIQVRESKAISNNFPHLYALESTPLLMLHSDSLANQRATVTWKISFCLSLIHTNTHSFILSFHILNQDIFPVILVRIKYLSRNASILTCLKGFLKSHSRENK